MKRPVKMKNSKYKVERFLKEDIIDIDYDLAITCVNAQKRTELFVNTLLSRNIRSNKTILLYDKLMEEKVSNFNFGDIIADKIEFDYNMQVKQFIDLMKSVITPIDALNTICIDISGLPIPLFYSLIKLVNIIGQEIKIDVYYCEAKTYFNSKYLYEEYEYSIDPLKLIEVPGFGGSFTNDKDPILIMLLGFEEKISSYVYSSIEPSNLIVINGFPSGQIKYKDISIVNNTILEEVDYRAYSATSNNPFETFNTLHKIIDENNDYIIVPMGPRPMALGACLYQLFNDKVKIQYVVPSKYKLDAEIEGKDYLWRYVLN